MDIIKSHSENLLRDGYVVLENLYRPETISAAREVVLSHRHLLKNTRPNPHSGHLAGFHRYPRLEHLHLLVSSHGIALAVLAAAVGSDDIRSIGLTDITLNRSQPWHVDLLRGKYRHHLDRTDVWGQGAGIYKALLYLQPSESLKVLPARHLEPIALDSDARSEPHPGAEIRSVSVNAGSLVLMDIRLPHRGSTEEELSRIAVGADDKILISTVLGSANHSLARAMEIGNLERQLDWDARHERKALAGA